MEQRTCPRCGDTFTTSHATKKYCSRQCCRAVANAKRRGTAVLPKYRDYYCAECGKHCVRGQNVVAHASKFCSPRCKKRDENRRLGPIRTLVKSDGSSAQILRWQSICALRADIWKVTKSCVCPQCGTRFTTTKRIQTYCKKTCKEYASHYRRKMRERAAWQEDVHLYLLGTRDFWVCGICQTAVDRSLRVPHHLAPTVDHIYPIAKGGKHCYSNVQLAHFICNSSKRDLLDTQGGDQRQKQCMTG
jgi:hypothetical protein